MTPSGPQWLKDIINEDVLDAWWAGLDYESKWAVACFLSHELYAAHEGTPITLRVQAAHTLARLERMDALALARLDAGLHDAWARIDANLHMAGDICPDCRKQATAWQDGKSEDGRLLVVAYRCGRGHEWPAPPNQTPRMA